MPMRPPAAALVQWFQIGKTCQKISSHYVVSRIFSSKFLAYSLDIRFRSFHALHIQNLSNCCGHKVNQSISRFFLNLIFGGFFFYPAQLCLGLNALATNCVRYFETVVRTTPTYATMILCPLSSTITVTSNASRPMLSLNMLQPLIG